MLRARRRRKARRGLQPSPMRKQEVRGRGRGRGKVESGATRPQTQAVRGAARMHSAILLQPTAWAAALSMVAATVEECVERCVKSPAPAGHFECCTNPLVSSFQAPSCATGCLMAEYAHNNGECNSMCEEAGKSAALQGCEYTIPHGGPTIKMCGGCDCGLHDCPGHPKPEPEICKDPANGGPDGGDCGWTNRCRGSIEGCKKGCVWGREVDDAGTAGLLFSVCVLLAAAAYTGGGIAIGIRSGRPRRGLRSHPHYSQFMQLRGLVVDGARFSQRRLRGGEVKEGSVNSHRQQSLLDDEREHSGSSSSSRSKSKKGKKLKRDKASSSSKSSYNR